jgi:hypothetical protein
LPSLSRKRLDDRNKLEGVRDVGATTLQNLVTLTLHKVEKGTHFLRLTAEPTGKPCVILILFLSLERERDTSARREKRAKVVRKGLRFLTYLRVSRFGKPSQKEGSLSELLLGDFKQL